ncbi:CBM35 domain-containing protein [Neobacillus cucumis]|uniref:CBM35 domain-containing protein n=1 Tax=Neobacillus cucumis TaxID=1740721 RepID=UPI002852F8A3|nr:CBM35 domain-containing protein [Neobacillus cucumis]MDR4945196.1 CBM35 domain-containing protein [Neobacillus cucumis]
MRKNKTIFSKSVYCFMLLTVSAIMVFSMSGLKAYARDSDTTRSGSGPMYWIGYEYPFVNDTALPESRWKANVDWIASNFKSSGYNMVSTDGWIEGATQTNANGYILKYNDSWENGWQYWENYAAQKGLNMGVYYNPLWVTQAAVNDTSKVVAGTKIPVANIVTAGDMFNGNPDPSKQLYWVDVTKPGAKEYIQGYVNYFKNMGIKFLRVDFLSWYESGTAAGAPSGAIAHGPESYATALKWMQEAAGNNLTLSLVMPNLYNHAVNELPTGDMFRIDDDVATGGWQQLSQGSFGDLRQTWQNHWSQWANPFLGFTGFSDLSGRGSVILDGDFLRLNTFSGAYADNEKKSAISLYTMAGAPLAIADQFDTIGNNLIYYKNQDILNVHKDGFVGKPVYYNGNPFEPTTSGLPDTGSRDSERWLGQTTDGNWVVALFNRSDVAATKSMNFSSMLGLDNGADVYDLWSHTDLGFKTNHTVTLEPHDVSMVKVVPNVSNPSINRYQAEVATRRGGAHFNNNHNNYSGIGFVDKLEADSAGANVVFAVNAPTDGTYDLNIAYANSMGYNSTATYTIQDSNSNQTSSGKVTLPNLANWNTWSNVHQPITLSAGLNYITIARNADDTGSFNLDYIELNNRTPQTVNLAVNPGFETGDLTGWTEWHPSTQATSFGVDSYDVHSGNCKLYFWNSTIPYKESVHQTINLPNGTYNVSGWVKLQAYSGVNPTTSRMELNNYGGSQVNVNFLPSSHWQQVSSTVTVTNGQLNVGFYLDADVNTSLQIDDVTISK